MRRIALFLATNMAVLLLISIVFQAFGIEDLLHSNGYDGDLEVLIVAAVVIVGFGGSFLCLLLSKWIAKRSTDIRIIDKPEDQQQRWLVNTVKQQAQQVGIVMPEVGIFDSPAPNTFTIGVSRNNSLVAVSAGLLQDMTKNEVEAVLAHEVSHISNGDMVTLGLIEGVVNAFVLSLSWIVGHFVERVILKSRSDYGPSYWITSIIAQIVFTILATPIVMWFSRWREFRADAGGAKLAGKQNMIAALKRLRNVYQPQDLPDGLAPFGISGSTGSGLKSLFMSHPPLEKRIAALKKISIIVDRS